MSRHIIQLADNKEMAYGHDHAMGYFFDIFDNSKDIDNEHEAHVAGADSLFGFKDTNKSFGNGDMMEVLKANGAPEAHINAVALDLTF